MGQEQSKKENCKQLLENEEIFDKDKNILKKKYLKWSLKNHPDKGGDTENFQKVTQCRDLLTINDSIIPSVKTLNECKIIFDDFGIKYPDVESLNENYHEFNEKTGGINLRIECYNIIKNDLIRQGKMKKYILSCEEILKDVKYELGDNPEDVFNEYLFNEWIGPNKIFNITEIEKVKECINKYLGPYYKPKKTYEDCIKYMKWYSLMLLKTFPI